MREEVIGECRLVLGDCLDVLAGMEAGSVDAVVTSPPYNTLPLKHAPSGLHGQRKSGVNQWIQRASEGYTDNRPEPEYQEWLRLVIGECLRVSKGLVWVNHKVRYRNGEAVHPVRFLPFPIYAEVIWNRRVSMALNCKRYAPSHEALWAFGKPAWWNDELNTLLSVWDLGFDTDPNEHPCAFPVELAERPIRSSIPENGICFEPYMGSGSTGIACIRSERRFLGVEQDSRYFDIACRRIERAVREEKSRLKFEPPPVETQHAMFREGAE